jgi:VanZ family protein
LLSVAYGIVDEVHQSFVPGRVCSVVDVLSDAFGAALAIALLGSCLSRSRVCNVALGACLVGSFASVAMATWGPW